MLWLWLVKKEGIPIRKFGKKVLTEQLYEKEIWVINLFDQNLNVIRRIESDITHP